MCPPVSPHKGASIVKYPMHNVCIFGMETPLRGRSGGHAGTAPTVSFGRIAHGRLVSFGRIARGRLALFGLIAHGVVGFVWVNYARGRLVAFEKEIWPSAIFSVLAPHPRVNTILLLHATG